MSEVKVNKISPRTACGTVTLGDSGDTFTIPAGATITNNGTAAGFGATGAASWDTTVKTTGFTAVSGVGYFVNTTAGAISVNLPAGTAGDVVAIKDYANTFNTNAVTLVQNGSDKIGGSTINAILSVEGLAVTLVYVDATQGWLVTDDGLQSQAVTNPYMVATGGTETTSGNFKIHTFTGPGTFCVSRIALCAVDNQVSYMVVAGGGAGGAHTGAGGGAGGFREVVSPSSPYTGSPLNGYPSSPNRITVTATGFPIIVGGGGSTTANAKGAPGANSVFSTITSAGGGGGGGRYPGTQSADNGGSGGGGGGIGGEIGATGNTPPVSPSQGNNGGNSVPNFAAGGGGGAGCVGANGASGGGNGGNGVTTSISASPTAYAGGGGGSDDNFPSGTGGTGGGGDGVVSPGGAGNPGTANTGGGGGGNHAGPPATGGNGGSGIVVIRYRFQ